jgi:hypothetical protein
VRGSDLALRVAAEARDHVRHTLRQHRIRKTGDVRFGEQCAAGLRQQERQTQTTVLDGERHGEKTTCCVRRQSAFGRDR